MICPSCGAENPQSATSCRACGQTLSGLTPGFVIASRYEILETLGKGGMGVVYRARDRVLDEDVAIKVLRPDVSASREITRRFLAEIKLARAVSHKNVCRIHEYGEDRGLQYISMAFVDGVDLKRILRERGPLAAEQAYVVALQVAQGLQAIHDEGIVHRDLKTPNLMMDARGVVRLMDFGIAKQSAAEPSSAVTGLGQIVGTPEYMSPEQIRGERLDARSDIYAFGIVIYELFTGETPFFSDAPMVVLIKHLQEAPSFEGAAAAKIPAALVPVLRKTLAKSREERFTTAREMAEVLRQARAESHPTASPTPVLTRLATAERLDPLPLPTLDLAAARTPVPTAIPTAVLTRVPALTAAPSAAAVEATAPVAERPRTESGVHPEGTPPPPRRSARWAVYAAVAGTAALVLATSVYVSRSRARTEAGVTSSVKTTGAPPSDAKVPSAPPPSPTQRPRTSSESATGARVASGREVDTLPPAKSPAGGRAPEPPAKGATVPGAQGVRHPLADEIEGILAEAESAFASQQYEAAMGFYEEALKLDSSNQRARIGRDLCGQAIAQAQTAGARGGSGKGFVGSQTQIVSSRPGSTGPAGFEDSPAVATRRVTQDPGFPGKIYFEVEPGMVRPADPFTVKVFLVNEGAVLVQVRSVTVTTTVNGRRASGTVPPLTNDAAPRQRTLLLSLADSWKADTTSWSMDVEIRTARGETLRSELAWK